MSPEHQELVIAQFCQWKQSEGDLEARRTWLDLTGEDMGPYSGMPYYTSDLNAMHEAEMSLSLEQRDEFRIHLMRICGGERAYHATAAQRAEAFLRTIGKCEEKQ